MAYNSGTAMDIRAALAGGGVHVVCFADAQAEGPDSLLATGAGLDEAERRLFCERVNTEDATGCLWPIAKLSALPARFVQAPITDPGALLRCLEAVFDFNARLCKCPGLVFDLRGASCNAELIAAELHRLERELAGTSLVQQLDII
jgi:hypothetical protein